MTLDTDVAAWLQAAGNLATFIGLPVAVVTYIFTSLRAAKDRQYGTYDALDDRYREFLQLCMDRLELGVYGADATFDESTLTDVQRSQREILMLNLISILERAFLMMYREHSIVMKSQWQGWQEYMTDFANCPSFARDWRTLGVQFERDFVDFMNSLVRKNFPDCVAFRTLGSR